MQPWPLALAGRFAEEGEPSTSSLIDAALTVVVLRLALVAWRDMGDAPLGAPDPEDLLRVAPRPACRPVKLGR